MFDVNELGSTDRGKFWIACWCFTAKGRTTVPLNKLLLWDQSLNVGDICNSLTSSPLKIFFYQQARSQPFLQTQIYFRKFISPVAPLPLFAAHRGSNSLLPCGKNLYRATEFSARGLARTLWFQSPIKRERFVKDTNCRKKPPSNHSCQCPHGISHLDGRALPAFSAREAFDWGQLCRCRFDDCGTAWKMLLIEEFIRSVGSILLIGIKIEDLWGTL